MADWRTRLLDAIDATGRSDREISLAAKLGANFVNELRRQTKVPSVDKVLAVIDEVGASRSYVFSAVDLSAVDERMLAAFLALEHEDRLAVLTLARRRV